MLTHDNAEYFVKSGCITSLLTILLRSMRDVIITEELKNNSEDSKISETLKGRADSMLLTEQTSIAAISALIEFAKHSKHARRSIASEKIVLRLHEDQPNRSNLKKNGRQTLKDISGLGLHIILFFTTTVVNKYLRRVATELTIELAREEQNVIIFRNEIGLTDELINDCSALLSAKTTEMILRLPRNFLVAMVQRHQILPISLRRILAKA